MKKIKIITLFLGALLLASCNDIKNAVNDATSSDALAGTTVGTTCGSVVKTLYTQYKSAGKIDLTNSSTLLSVTELGPCVISLTNNKNNSDYLTAFTKALVIGSSGVITSSNSNSFVNLLLSATSLSNITSSLTSNSTGSTNIITDLTTLLDSLK